MAVEAMGMEASKQTTAVARTAITMVAAVQRVALPADRTAVVEAAAAAVAVAVEALAVPPMAPASSAGSKVTSLAIVLRPCLDREVAGAAGLVEEAEEASRTTLMSILTAA